MLLIAAKRITARHTRQSIKKVVLNEVLLCLLCCALKQGWLPHGQRLCLFYWKRYAHYRQAALNALVALKVSRAYNSLVKKAVKEDCAYIHRSYSRGQTDIRKYSRNRDRSATRCKMTASSSYYLRMLWHKLSSSKRHSHENLFACIRLPIKSQTTRTWKPVQINNIQYYIIVCLRRDVKFTQNTTALNGIYCLRTLLCCAHL